MLSQWSVARFHEYHLFKSVFIQELDSPFKFLDLRFLGKTDSSNISRGQFQRMTI